jgi:DNA-binding transcriptional LysR family regulator
MDDSTASFSQAAQIDLNRLQVFVTVVQARSFTAASQLLGLAKARVSQQVSRLESDLGANLLVRTTRRLALTDAGKALFVASAPLLDHLRAAANAVRPEGTTLRGTLRISTSVDHAAQLVARATTEFGRQHPGLVIELHASDRIVDLVGEGIDLAIRAGKLPDSSLKGRRLLQFEPFMVASPEYLRLRGTPREPAELAAHDWVAMMQWPSPLTLRLSRDGRQTTVRLKSRLRVDANPSLRAALAANAGVGALDPWSAATGLADGSLVRVLPQWSLPSVDLNAVYPAGRTVPVSTRTFIDFYVSFLASAGVDDRRRSAPTQMPLTLSARKRC